MAIGAVYGLLVAAGLYAPEPVVEPVVDEFMVAPGAAVVAFTRATRWKARRPTVAVMSRVLRT